MTCNQRKPTEWIFSTPIPRALREAVKPGDTINGDVVDFIEPETGRWHPRIDPKDSGLVRGLTEQALL